MLVREPTNKFDPNAVAVWINGQHVGYLAKDVNQPIAARIDASGTPWINPNETARADDAEPIKAITVKMVRSPNSGYPQVEIGE